MINLRHLVPFLLLGLVIDYGLGQLGVFARVRLMLFSLSFFIVTALTIYRVERLTIYKIDDLAILYSKKPQLILISNSVNVSCGFAAFCVGMSILNMEQNLEWLLSTMNNAVLFSTFSVLIYQMRSNMYSKLLTLLAIWLVFVGFGLWMQTSSGNMCMSLSPYFAALKCFNYATFAANIFMYVFVLFCTYRFFSVFIGNNRVPKYRVSK